MKHPMSDRLRKATMYLSSEAGLLGPEAAAVLDRQRRDIAILCDCIEATRNPSMNRVYAECDVAAALERNRCPASA